MFAHVDVDVLKENELIDCKLIKVYELFFNICQIYCAIYLKGTLTKIDDWVDYDKQKESFFGELE